MRVILGCMSVGLTFAETFGLLLCHEHPVGGGKSGPQARGDHHRERAIKRVWAKWAKATAYTASRPRLGTRAEFRAAVNAISEAASLCTWRGRTGPTDRSVFEAIVTRALRYGVIELSVSHRVLAEETKLGLYAAGHGLRRLADNGFIEIPNVCRRPAGGTRSRLAMPTMSQTHDKSYLASGGVTVGAVLRQTQHDSFRNDASARLTHSTLDLVHPLTVRQIADGTGRHRTTIYRSLHRLARLGLARRLADGTWLRLAKTLDEVAEMTGRAGMTEDQHARHVRDRECFKEEYEARYGSYVKVVDQETGHQHLLLTMGSWPETRAT
jgi:hypothetical protein